MVSRWDRVGTSPDPAGVSSESTVSKPEDHFARIVKSFLDGSVNVLRYLYQPWKEGSLSNGRNVGRHAATIDRPISIILQYMQVLMITDRDGES